MFGVDRVANVKTQKILHKVFSFMKIFKFLQGLVGFGNFRFAEIKSHPSAYQTSPLLKMLRSWIFWAFTQPPDTTRHAPDTTRHAADNGFVGL